MVVIFMDFLKLYQTEQGFNDAAAAAEQFQPKGTTLSTTEVYFTWHYLI